MMIFMVIVLLLVFGLLIIVTGIVPQRSTMSLFELERRAKDSDKTATAILRRERLLGDVLSLQRIVSALLLVIFVSVAVASFGWFFGILVSLFVALEYGAIARMSTIQIHSQKLYVIYEPVLLPFVEKTAPFLRFIRINTPKSVQAKQLDSREELQHMVMQSGSLLSVDEKKLIEHGLKFDARQVSEIMTPRGVIDSINKDEMLGPLVLDDLHKTGHSRFPVIDGDIDHVVGLLYVQSLLTLDTKKTTTVEKAMDPRVYYIREDQTLQHALAAFLRTHHHLFVVVNEFRETVGLLSLEDVVEALLGRKIVDEFDVHDDLRVVAERNPRGNNKPEKRQDV